MLFPEICLLHLLSEQWKYGAGFRATTAAIMKISVFWYITTCGPLKANRRFSDGIFLRNIGCLSKEYTALYYRSQIFQWK
jgi:hypothetical protein